MVGPTRDVTEYVSLELSHAKMTLGSGLFVGPVTTENPLYGSYVLPWQLQFMKPVLLEPECPGWFGMVVPGL